MNKKGTKALASATLMSLVLTTALATGNVKAAANGQATRVGGTDRYETAAKVATANFTTSENVVLVSGEGYADSVSASVLAKKLDAPIVLTGSKTLDANAKSAIETLKAKNVYIIGGTGSISASIESGLKSNYTVTRLGGKDRYATNLAIANKLVDLGVSKDNIIAVAGTGFADALSVAPVAAADNEILLLTNNNADTMKNTAEFAKDSNVTVVGTTNVVSDSIYNQLKADKRIKGGDTRFETNINVLNAFDKDLKADKLYVASATQANPDNLYADALVASAIAGKYAAPLVLVDKDGSTGTDNAVKYIGTKATKATDLQVVGGTGVVSDNTIDDIKEAVVGKHFTGDVTSVETVADQTVNAKADDEELQFTVNGGQTATVDDLNAEGYTVKFTADTNVFGGTDTSYTGKLSKNDLQDILPGDSFKYNVQVLKDGNLVASTSNEKVKVISGDETATSISDVTLKDTATGGKITSGKITRSDSLKVDKVKGTLVNGADDVTVTNVKYYSSDNSIATVNETSGSITVNPSNTDGGNFNLIVKSGSTTKEIPLQVVNGTRKATTATASVSSVKIAKGTGSSKFDITIKDQYGDAFAVKTPNIDSTVKSGDDTIANVTTTTTDKDGKTEVTVTATGNDGNDYLYVKNSDSLNILSVPVEVVDEAGSSAWEVKPANDDSKNLLIDLNPQSNDDNATDELTLNINKLTTSGAISAQNDIKNYQFYVQSQKSNDSLNDDNYIKLYASDGTTALTQDASGAYTTSAAGKDLIIKGVSATAKVGKVNLIVKNNETGSDNKGTTKTIAITTEDTSPSVATSSVLNDKTITSGNSVAISDIVDVDNIKLNGSSAYGDGKVRIAKDGTLFIDVKSTDSDAATDNSGIADVDDTVIGTYNVKYNAAQDVTIGKVRAYPASGDAASDLTDAHVTGSVDGETADGTISFTVPDTKKGKFTVSITSVRDNTSIVSKDITVDKTQY